MEFTILVKAPYNKKEALFLSETKTGESGVQKI